MSALPLIERHHSELVRLCDKYGVRRLQLFGSGVGKQWREGQSDLDLVADFAPPPEGMNGFRQMFGFVVELEAMYGCRVGLLEAAAIRKESLLTAIATSAVELYAAKSRAYSEVANLTESLSTPHHMIMGAWPVR